MDKTKRIAKGLLDPVDQAALLLTDLLPRDVVNVGNSLNNRMAEYGLVGMLPKGGLKEKINQEEKSYRSQIGNGVDGYRMLGNLLSPMNLWLASKVPQAATIGQRAMYGISGGIGTAPQVMAQPLPKQWQGLLY
jgi:hypothetical protein